MSIQYEPRDDRVTAVLKDGKQIGVITAQPDGKTGFTLFGTPHRGAVQDETEARQQVERLIAD
ncbi:MAG TPA: hypothetical protein VMK65_01625 [Longimicrobiales bacterium]|nr:hypothetical protein [Longimicrobiales bacterium]